jgi:hypothetical protein
VAEPQWQLLGLLLLLLGQGLLHAASHARHATNAGTPAERTMHACIIRQASSRQAGRQYQ